MLAAIIAKADAAVPDKNAVAVLGISRQSVTSVFHPGNLVK
jgi:hypothetical protein